MRFSMMRILMVLLFSLAACSGEEQQPPQAPPPKVVQPIKPSVADVVKPTMTLAEEKKPQAEEESPEEKPVDSQEQPGTAPKPEAEDKKVVSEKAEKDEPGIYLVKKGDSLSSVAAQSDVMKDPLKWPILLRLNRDKLEDWGAGEDLPNRELPQGTRLRAVTARDAGASLKKETGTPWVANVLSATTHAEIVPPAVTLVKEGYPVYIVRAHVKGKDYMRLRVGFFKSKSEADKVGKRIKERLNFRDSWSTKADKEEYEEVARFFNSIEKH